MNLSDLKEEIKNITEPRRTAYGNIRHKLEDIIIIGLCTIICGGEDFSDMEAFGKEREDLLRNFLELPNGIPDSDTFRRLFERLDPQELSACLRNWIGAEREKHSVIAVDGKTIRGSGNREHKAYHVVSAFVAENQITLGEITTAEKSNEITAVPELLDLIDVEGAIVTADAMSCQSSIIKKIREKGADFTVTLKENQHELYEDAVESLSAFEDEKDYFSTIEKSHGRIEKREYFLLKNLTWLTNKKKWDGVRAFGAEISTVTKIAAEEKTCRNCRYFITSLSDINEFAYSVRKHWSVENQLHWSLDVIYGEDSAKNRKDNSPLNMNVLRKTALSLVTEAQYGRFSKKKMMFKAALNPDVLLNIILGYKK